jgi:phospholipase/carboxylesterase
LRAVGYDVTYEEFTGGHEVPAGIVRRAMGWLSPPAAE